MNYQAKKLLELKAKHGESASYVKRSGIILFCDCLSDRIWSYDPASRKTEEHRFGFTPKAVIENGPGGYLAVSENTLYLLRDDFSVLKVLCQFHLPEKQVFNDCRCTPDGSVYLGTMGLPGDENRLLCFHTDGTVSTVLENVSCSNGFAWSKDEHTFYYTDTKHHEIYRYTCQSDGTLRNKTVLFHDDTCLPDGFTIDENDDLWVALWGKGQLWHISGTDGSVLDTVDVGPSYVTSCVFGGSGFSELFITTSRNGIPSDETREGLSPSAGDAYVLCPPVCGRENAVYPGNFPISTEE